MSVECRSPHQASIDTIFGAVEKLLAQLQAEGYQTETVGLMEVAPVHLSEKDHRRIVSRAARKQTAAEDVAQRRRT